MLNVSIVARFAFIVCTFLRFTALDLAAVDENDGIVDDNAKQSEQAEDHHEAEIGLHDMKPGCRTDHAQRND